MKCSGIHAVSGEEIGITFEDQIVSIEPALEKLDDPPMLSPGWIDLQVNGFTGVDYNSPSTSHEEIARSLGVLFSCGVTRFYPTVITGSLEDMAGALKNLAEAREKLPNGEAMEGFHVEGPHISPEEGPRGAHPLRWVRPPDIEEFHRLQDAARGHVRLLTLSPEWPEAPRYIEVLAKEGVVVSIGHTKAVAEQIQDAVSAGATMSTHLGNGSHSVLPRHPNYIWEQLAEDRLAAGFIVDGIHLPKSFVKVALRAKGVERSVLVTDASTPAGSKPGRYKLGEQDVDLTPDNRVVLAGTDRLAGSALRMERGVENLMKFAGLSLGEALTMATTNPARVGRIASRQKGLAPGERADLVQFRLIDGEIRIERTFLAGREVYSRN